MLNGIDPIIIFQLYKNVDAEETTPDPCPCAPGTRIPITSKVKKKVTFAVIPIYLSESITGIFIDSESKNIDIETVLDSLTIGTDLQVNQKTIGSTITVNLVAKQGSIGLTILLALAEKLIDKVTSQEYEVTYMHGATTLFGGLLHGFSFDQNGSDDLIKIKLELSRGRPKSKSIQVGEDPDAVRLGSTGSTPPADAPTTSAPAAGNTGKSVIQPGISQARP